MPFANRWLLRVPSYICFVGIAIIALSPAEYAAKMAAHHQKNILPPLLLRFFLPQPNRTQAAVPCRLSNSQAAADMY